jgi:hypothetical protein
MVHKNTLEIKKICSSQIEFLLEKILALVNEITMEMVYLNKNEQERKNLLYATEGFNEIRPLLIHILKHDSAFVMPYIKKVLNLLNKNDQEAFENYQNLKGPVADLITKQVMVISLFNRLRSDTNNYNLFFETDSACKKLIFNIFELNQQVEKYVFVEENLLFPGLVQLFQTQLVKPN